MRRPYWMDDEPDYLDDEFGQDDGLGLGGAVPLGDYGMRRGIPRTPGMSLADPSSDERLDEILGLEAPEYDDGSDDPGFDVDPLDEFLERLSQGGVPQGLQKPRGFFQGLVSGAAQGAMGRGQRVGERRKKFEASQTQRAAERDRANAQATRDYRTQRAAGQRDLGRENRAERRAREKEDRDNPTVTPEMAAAQPELARLVGQPVPRAWLKPADPNDAVKETRRKFENDREYNLRVRAENRQGVKDTADAAEKLRPGGGKPPTVAQERAQLFYSRAKESTVNAVKGGLESRMLKKAWSLEQPPQLQGDPDTRAYWRAMESFALALNRLESGAAIAPTEFAKVKQLYFVIPGDSKADIQDKIKMRETIIESLWRMQSPDMQEQTADSGGATITPAQLWEP